MNIFMSLMQAVNRRTMGLVAAILLTSAIITQSQNMASFSTPTKKQRQVAIGETQYLPIEEKKAFSESASYHPKTSPKSRDWLANHREPGQSFDHYLLGRRNLFKNPRKVIYIQPLGDFTADERVVLDKVAEYARIFFSAEVKLQNTLDPSHETITSRKNPGEGHRQFLSTDILKLLKTNLPNDAYARIAVTMTDLYPAANWNFVFGQASIVERTGVYSFSRYGKPGTENFLRRCVQVFSHETGHMFAFRHCIHYQCLMNGSNHLDETDQTPLHLCPICLRKLHTANHLDILKRYESLHRFYDDNKMTKEATWTKDRIATIR